MIGPNAALVQEHRDWLDCFMADRIIWGQPMPYSLGSLHDAILYLRGPQLHPLSYTSSIPFGWARIPITELLPHA